MSALRYTIVAIAGDNGQTFAIGQYGSRDGAARQAALWQAAENPDLEPDGMRYSVCPLRTVREWRAAS